MDAKTRWIRPLLVSLVLFVAGGFGGWLLGRTASTGDAESDSTPESSALPDTSLDPASDAPDPDPPTAEDLHFRGRSATRIPWKTPGPCWALVDGEAIVGIDGVVDSMWVFHYDAGNQVESLDHDYWMDGKIDARTVYRRDEDGQIVGELYDCNADGAIDETFTYLTDDGGRKQLAVISRLPGHASVCYGEDHRERLDIDEETPGTSRPEVLRAWGATLLSLGVRDVSALEPIDSVVRYQYDPDGKLIAEEWDMDGNGAIEEVIRFVYNPGGNLAWEYHDDGPDGSVEISAVYDHGCWIGDEMPEPDDLPAQPCGGAWDLDDDGVVDGYTRNVYDDQGRLILTEADWDADGQVDNRFHYTYGDDGRRKTEEWEAVLDGSRDEIVTLHYDELGFRTMGDVDEGGDGSVDGRVTYEYDGIERLWRENWDKDGDGELDEVLNYYYDGSTRLASARYDDLKDVQSDETVMWLYECSRSTLP